MVCSKTCKNNADEMPGTRTRTVLTDAQHSGATCPNLEEQCNDFRCPIDCEVTQWGYGGVLVASASKFVPAVLQAVVSLKGFLFLHVPKVGHISHCLNEG